MLGRRQIREKVLQSLYAIKVSENDSHTVEKNLMEGIRKLYDLYILLLNLNLALVARAELRLQRGKEKKLPNSEDLNPNLRFIENRIYAVLKSNRERIKYCEKNQQLVWDAEGSFVANLLLYIQELEVYKTYMAASESGFKHDKTFAITLFEDFIADYEGLEDWVEDLNLHWADDLHIANTMVSNTMQSITPKSDENIQLFKPFKNADDRSFAEDLFRKTFNNQDKSRKIIEEKAANWEIDRMPHIDLVILQMALTEFLHFREIPPKVTLNEYIELAKTYSTEKSKIFVNGVLDKCLKDLEADFKR